MGILRGGVVTTEYLVMNMSSVGQEQGHKVEANGGEKGKDPEVEKYLIRIISNWGGKLEHDGFK